MKYELKQLQIVQLELLDELMRVCEQNNITFYLAAGSCIGAVRHQGFIPWDDDIDIFMYADDVDKLFECMYQFREDFFLQSTFTDPGYRHAIARLRKNNTTCMEPDDIGTDCHHGIFLDIYILYYYPKNKFERIIMVQRGIRHNILLSNRPPLNHGPIIKFLGKLILLPYRNEIRRLSKINHLKNKIRKYHDTDDLVILYGMDISLKRIISYKAEWFKSPKYLIFENRRVPVATNADAYLRCRYGDDYMVLPPENKRHSYHKYQTISFTK